MGFLSLSAQAFIETIARYDLIPPLANGCAVAAPPHRWLGSE